MVIITFYIQKHYVSKVPLYIRTVSSQLGQNKEIKNIYI